MLNVSDIVFVKLLLQRMMNARDDKVKNEKIKTTTC